jgi:hypothetical protein
MMAYQPIENYGIIGNMRTVGAWGFCNNHYCLRATTLTAPKSESLVARSFVAGGENDSAVDL